MINRSFVRFGADARLVSPLTITGGKDEIILRKGERFDEWLADDSKIVLNNGVETTYNAQNQEILRRIVVAWLNGEDYEYEQD